MRSNIGFSVLLLVWALSGCAESRSDRVGEDTDLDSGSDADSDADSDTDIDSDSDGDGDTDSDTDSDSDADPGSDAGAVDTDPPDECSDAGVLNGYACWYFGASNAGCDTTCAPHGGYNEATKDDLGSGGTDIACDTILGLLGAPGDPTALACDALGGLGCAVMGGTYAVRCVTPDTTAEAEMPEMSRVCGCNE
jgi:hypothetical protein